MRQRISHIMASRSPSGYGTFSTSAEHAANAEGVVGTNAHPSESLVSTSSNAAAAMTKQGDSKASADIEPSDHQTLNEAIEHEHALTFWEAVRLYPTAVGWSAFVSIGVIMLAFDPQIVGNMFAIPQFKKDFGTEHANGEVR